MRNTKAAFLWIINILKKHKVPYQITGGFAAKIYGVKRELADIDIEVPEEKYDDAFDNLRKDVKPFIVFGPKRYKKEGFNVFLMTLKYKGQLIDICGTHTDMLFDKRKRKMIKTPVYLKKYTKKQLNILEREMRQPAHWENADHTVSYKGPTSIRFPEDVLKKLHAIARVRHKPINRLVNEYVKPFVDGEFAILERLK